MHPWKRQPHGVEHNSRGIILCDDLVHRGVKKAPKKNNNYNNNNQLAHLAFEATAALSFFSCRFDDFLLVTLGASKYFR
jgi:hypothetical protein